MSARQSRVQSQSSFKFSNSFARLFQPDIAICQIAMGIGVVGLYPKRLQVPFPGLLLLAARVQRRSQIIARDKIGVRDGAGVPKQSFTIFPGPDLLPRE